MIPTSSVEKEVKNTRVVASEFVPDRLSANCGATTAAIDLNVKFQPGSSSTTAIIVHTVVCSWAQCIVLDSAEFLCTNPWTGDEQQPFVVLAAFG